jgi:hypothetical protein
MTAPTTQDREIAERAALLIQYHKTCDWNEALAMATEQLAAEHEQDAERQVKAKELSDNMQAFWVCGCCRVGNAYGSLDALCDACRPIVAQLATERRAAELVNGRSRRELAAAYIDARADIYG